MASNGPELHCCTGILRWSQGKMHFCSSLIERKQSKTVPRQRCVKDEYGNPDSSLTSECGIGALSLTLMEMV